MLPASGPVGVMIPLPVTEILSVEPAIPTLPRVRLPPLIAFTVSVVGEFTVPVSDMVPLPVRESAPPTAVNVPDAVSTFVVAAGLAILLVTVMESGPPGEVKEPVTLSKLGAGGVVWLDDTVMPALVLAPENMADPAIFTYLVVLAEVRLTLTGLFDVKLSKFTVTADGISSAESVLPSKAGYVKVNEPPVAGPVAGVKLSMSAPLAASVFKSAVTLA